MDLYFQFLPLQMLAVQMQTWPKQPNINNIYQFIRT